MNVGRYIIIFKKKLDCAIECVKYDKYKCLFMFKKKYKQTKNVLNYFTNIIAGTYSYLIKKTKKKINKSKENNK